MFGELYTSAVRVDAAKTEQIIPWESGGVMLLFDVFFRVGEVGNEVSPLFLNLR